MTIPTSMSKRALLFLRSISGRSALIILNKESTESSKISENCRKKYAAKAVNKQPSKAWDCQFIEK
jgi:hypothetical protein